MQPSTTDEIVRGDLVHYYVHGRDKDMFEIRMDETAYLHSTIGGNQGPWRLHYKQKVSKKMLGESPNRTIHHHIKVIYSAHNTHAFQNIFLSNLQYRTIHSYNSNYEVCL